MISRENEYLLQIRDLFKDRRIALGLKQMEVASRSGVNIATFRLFEKSGQISLVNLLKISVLYKIDQRLMASITDRSWWSIVELERAERFKTVR
ncbi:MAG: hypothetical protein PF693_14100 [Spirochaetia bacterium]|jgi:transcriptional regulator with XRE-family HTH domain|nr:hypothetical protein [Spirochaetia bacterium]